MTNIAKQIQFTLLLILASLAIACVTLMMHLGYSLDYRIYVTAIFVVGFVALRKGIISGLIISVFAVLLYAVTYSYYTIKTSMVFNIGPSQAIWFLAYPIAGIVLGKIGDGLLFFTKLQKNYPQEMKNLFHDNIFPLVSIKKFNHFIEEEIARSRRMQTNFCLARVTIDDIEEINRIFGNRGIYKVTNKIKHYLKNILRDHDKVTQLNNMNLEILFSGLTLEQTTLRLAYLQHQLENAYLLYKRKEIRFMIKTQTNISCFPENGEDISILRKKIEGKYKRIGDILIGDGLISEEDLKKALLKQKDLFL